MLHVSLRGEAAPEPPRPATASVSRQPGPVVDLVGKPPLPISHPALFSSSLTSHLAHEANRNPSASRASSFPLFSTSNDVMRKEEDKKQADEGIQNPRERERRNETSSHQTLSPPPGFPALSPESLRLNAALAAAKEKAEWKESKLKELEEVRQIDLHFSKEIDSRLAVSQTEAPTGSKASALSPPFPSDLSPESAHLQATLIAEKEKAEWKVSTIKEIEELKKKEREMKSQMADRMEGIWIKQRGDRAELQSASEQTATFGCSSSV